MKNFTSCFKEKDFLQFFFNRVKMNKSERYTDTFPYISLCGRERNFIRCDDRPIVYTHVIYSKSEQEPDLLSYGGAAERLTVPFEPEQVCMLPHSGRVYYPSSSHTGGIGLVKSSLAIEFSKMFNFEHGEENPPTQFMWRDKTYDLTNELINKLEDETVE